MFRKLKAVTMKKSLGGKFVIFVDDESPVRFKMDDPEALSTFLDIDWCLHSDLCPCPTIRSTRFNFLREHAQPPGPYLETEFLWRRTTDRKLVTGHCHVETTELGGVVLLFYPLMWFS